MNFFLDCLGIHSADIEHAYTEAEDVLKQVYLDNRLDDIVDETRNVLCSIDAKETFDWNNPSDSIIQAIFMAIECMVESVYEDNVTITNYINGYDSHLYIEEDSYFASMLRHGITKELAVRAIKSGFFKEIPLDSEYVEKILDDTELFENMVSNLENGADFVVYGSVEELGEDNSDNGTREKDDTDETFGMFLLEAYKQGQTNGIVYWEVGNGEVIVI